MPKAPMMNKNHADTDRVVHTERQDLASTSRRGKKPLPLMYKLATGHPSQQDGSCCFILPPFTFAPAGTTIHIL